jgi:ribose transport system ATP-binding protein
MSARLSATGIRKSFGGTVAVDGVDMALHAGEMLGLVGANGAGKSTLVKIVCGAIPADAGSVAIDGRDVSFRSVADAQAAGIAVAHQQVAIIPCLTGAENIMLGQEPTRSGLIADAALRRGAQAHADRFGVAIDLARECSEHSLGELKILDILKAMARDPAVLILDEPTASLSLAETRKLFAFLAELRRRGLAILFISHHLNEVFGHCDRVMVMKDGAKVLDDAVARSTPGEIVRLMVGRAVEAVGWTSHASDGEPAIHLGAARIGRLGVPELTVRRGEVVGIAGVLGAGQTELLERLAGVPHPASVGTARVGRLDRLPSSVREAVRSGIFLVADDRLRKSLFRGLDVGENVAAGALAQFTRGGFMQGRRLRDAVAASIAGLRVRCEGQQQDVLQLSGGNQQKVVFGRWLLRMAHDAPDTPPILLLDNPTEGVDVGAKAEIYALIGDLAARGAAVLVASSEFSELAVLCDRVYCVAHGALATCLPHADLSEDRLLLEVA